MSVVKQQIDQQAVESSLTNADVLAPWRAETDPFANASPARSISELIGGLPDERDADEILRDLAHCRLVPTRRHRLRG